MSSKVLYKKNKVSPVQVSHLLLPITKRLHYFYANQALYPYAGVTVMDKNQTYGCFCYATQYIDKRII
jgi:hypothetical protein